MRFGYVSDLRFDMQPDFGVRYCQSIDPSKFDALICAGNLAPPTYLKEALLNLGQVIWPKPLMFIPSFIEGWDPLLIHDDWFFTRCRLIQAPTIYQFDNGEAFHLLNDIPRASIGSGLFVNSRRLESERERGRVDGYRPVSEASWNAVRKSVIVSSLPPSNHDLITGSWDWFARVGGSPFNFVNLRHMVNLKYWIHGFEQASIKSLPCLRSNPQILKYGVADLGPLKTTKIKYLTV